MIGGKVLDASALAALVRGRLSMVTWVSVAASVGLVLYVPALALVEVRAVRPDAAAALADLLADPAVVVGELDAATAGAVDQVLESVGLFDALGGQVVHVARRRGWPALTDDPGRLRRIEPELELELL